MTDETGSDVARRCADGKEALRRGAWAEAAAIFESVLAIDEPPEALEGYALARWWQDDVAAAIETRERAYVRRRRDGHTIEATLDAALLAWDHGAMRGADAVAQGWLLRARRLADEIPPHGAMAWLPLIEASFHIDTDADAVLRLSTEAEDLARRHGALDPEMTARTLRGLALVTLGRRREGMALLDEGAAAASSGELRDPLAIGSCHCNMIIACERLRDFDRMRQWCDRLEGVAERTGQRPVLGLCRAHRGSVRTMSGAWDAAEADLTWSAATLAELRPPLAAYANARLAELRRRQGRAGEARSLLDTTGGHALGSLGHAALALDEGDLTEALGHVERYLRRTAGNGPVEEAAAWELLVPVHLGRDEADAAHRAHDELAALAALVGGDPFAAAERLAASRVALAGGDADLAVRAADEAVERYRLAAQPFEAAEARLELARGLAATGRATASRDQAGRAATAFETLGAITAARRARRVARRFGAGPGLPAALTGREREVLRLVAGGLSNREIAAELVISEHTVHRHVANVFTKLGVSSRAAAVAEAADRHLLDEP